MKQQLTGGALQKKSSENFSKLIDKHKKLSFGGALPKKKVLKNFAKLTEKYLCRGFFLMKLQARNLQLPESVSRDLL